MVQRDRLIELIKKSEFYGENECVDCQNIELCNKCSFHLDMSKLADYLLDNGVIVPPCKVGDKVYVPSGDEGMDYVDEYQVKCFYCSSRGINRFYIECGTMGNNFRPKDIGKTVFLTREEAERALEAKQ